MASSRPARRSKALVVGAEVFSRILDWNDRGTCVLFGDGAGAVVLGASETPGILASRAARRRRLRRHPLVPGNVCGGKIVGAPFLQMDGQARVQVRGAACSTSRARETLAAAGMRLADIDWLIPHQANIRIMEARRSKLELAAREADRHGRPARQHLGGFDSARARRIVVRKGGIRPGDTVMLEGVGGGFTWGAVLGW